MAKAARWANGTWYSTAVPYIQPEDAGGVAFDIMPKINASDVWIDVCSTDVVADSTNYETVKLCKQSGGDAYLSCTKAGSGTVRDLRLQTGGGHVAVGNISPTAWLHIKAGTATAGQAPIKLTAGVLLGTPEDGALEYANSHLYFTIGASRSQII